MRMLLCVPIAALATAVPVASQVPQQNPPQGMPAGGRDAISAPRPGDAVDYRTSHGRTLRMTLVEATGDRFVWELHDITGTPRLAARITQDAQFRILANDDAGGVTRYDPHDCEKVLGVCRYTVHHPDGSAADELRVNGIAAGVWNYSLWRNAGGEMRPVGIGEICYDAAGLSLRESWTDLDSAAGYSLERIRPDGTPADCSTAVSPLE